MFDDFQLFKLKSFISTANIFKIPELYYTEVNVVTTALFGLLCLSIVFLYGFINTYIGEALCCHGKRLNFRHNEFYHFWDSYFIVHKFCFTYMYIVGVFITGMCIIWSINYDKTTSRSKLQGLICFEIQCMYNAPICLIDFSNFVF
jgi:hypothetical protein